MQIYPLFFEYKIAARLYIKCRLKNAAGLEVSQPQWAAEGEQKASEIYESCMNYAWNMREMCKSSINNSIAPHMLMRYEIWIIYEDLSILCTLMTKFMLT